MIKIEMLRAFREVARAGSLVEGAAAIGRTPSAVSMTLKALEDHLGGPLFETDRKRDLSPLGQYALELAERELVHFDRTLRLLERFAGGYAGEVRIAAVPSFANAVLPGVIKAFTAGREDVRFDIRDMDSGSIIAGVLDRTVDLGVVSQAATGPQIAVEALREDRFGLIVPGDSPLTGAGSLAWSALSGVALIDNPLCDALGPYRRLALQPRLRVHNTTTLLAMVRAGLGVTVLPELVCAGLTPESGLSFIPLTGPELRREVSLIQRQGEGLSPAGERFRNFLRDRVGGRQC